MRLSDKEKSNKKLARYNKVYNTWIYNNMAMRRLSREEKYVAIKLITEIFGNCTVRTECHYILFIIRDDTYDIYIDVCTRGKDLSVSVNNQHVGFNDPELREKLICLVEGVKCQNRRIK
jgi:hypothetical protein